MNSEQTDAVLIEVLETLKEQAIYLHRQHGWMIAIAETVEKNPDLASHLKLHPFFDQGPRPDTYIAACFLEKVDALIRRLKNQ
jgi:hypothetical protein